MKTLSRAAKRFLFSFANGEKYTPAHTTCNEALAAGLARVNQATMRWELTPSGFEYVKEHYNP